jgi:hypothetical protein
MLTERCHWLRLPRFKARAAQISARGYVICEAQLAKNVRQLEIWPEAAAEILERAANLSGKVFHKFSRLQQTLRGD